MRRSGAMSSPILWSSHSVSRALIAQQTRTISISNIVARQVPVELPFQPRPRQSRDHGQPFGLAARLFLGGVGGDEHAVTADAQRVHLLGAGALQKEDADKGVGRIDANRERAVIAEQHELLVAEIGDETFTFIEIER